MEVAVAANGSRIADVKAFKDQMLGAIAPRQPLYWQYVVSGCCGLLVKHFKN